jgi:hypothetical protein
MKGRRRRVRVTLEGLFAPGGPSIEEWISAFWKWKRRYGG